MNLNRRLAKIEQEMERLYPLRDDPFEGWTETERMFAGWTEEELLLYAKTGEKPSWVKARLD